jgi:LmbE family N-acetylglucosaminyl deacetylase
VSGVDQPSEVSGLPVGDLLTDGPVTVDLPVPASALAVGAHPDDIEFGCGATLAKWAAAGCRVHHLILTDGSKGSWDPEADLATLVADRAAESRRAAAVLDGSPEAHPADRVLFLGSVDGELVNEPVTRREVARIVRTLRPQVVLGHDPWRRYRLHPDHRHAGFLTVDSLVAARDPHFFPELGLPPHRPDHLLLWEADLPNHVEPADRFESVKIEALLVHASQRQSTMGIEADGHQSQQVTDFAERVHRQLRSHGALAHLPTGEAFRLLSDL